MIFKCPPCPRQGVQCVLLATLRPRSLVGETRAHRILTLRSQKAQPRKAGSRDPWEGESPGRAGSLFIEVRSPFTILKVAPADWLSLHSWRSDFSELPSPSLLLASRGRCPGQWTRAGSTRPNFPTESVYLVSPLLLPGSGRQETYQGGKMCCLWGWQVSRPHVTWMGRRGAFLFPSLEIPMLGPPRGDLQGMALAQEYRQYGPKSRMDQGVACKGRRAK